MKLLSLVPFRDGPGPRMGIGSGMGLERDLGGGSFRSSPEGLTTVGIWRVKPHLCARCFAKMGHCRSLAAFRFPDAGPRELSQGGELVTKLNVGNNESGGQRGREQYVHDRSPQNEICLCNGRGRSRDANRAKVLRVTCKKPD